MKAKPPNRYNAGEAAAAKLDPIKKRMLACGQLLSAAVDDVDDKMKRAATAGERYAQSEAARASAVELKGSSKLGRAIEEIKLVKKNLSQVVRELEQLIT